MLWVLGAAMIMIPSAGFSVFIISTGHRVEPGETVFFRIAGLIAKAGLVTVPLGIGTLSCAIWDLLTKQ